MCPIFSYECPRGHRFDKFAPIDKMDENQPCPGRMVEPGADPDEMPELVPCGAPAERLEVPSSPANFIIK